MEIEIELGVLKEARAGDEDLDGLNGSGNVKGKQWLVMRARMVRKEKL